MDQAEKINMRAAVDLLAAWLDAPSGQFPTGTMIQLIEEQGQGDDIEGAVSLLMGTVALAGELLVEVMASTGLSEEATLREIAKRYT